MSESDTSVPYGFCHCGCGQKTTVATYTNSRWGAVKGEPRRFVQGHRSLAPEIDRFWDRVDRRDETECWPWTGATNHGYGMFRIGGRLRGAHTIAAEQTFGPRPDGLDTRHLCGFRLCCNPAHLSYGTRSENERDKVRHGRSNRGSRQGQAKLTDAQVREIRERRARGETGKSLAGEFGVSEQSVCDIVKRRTWSWL